MEDGRYHARVPDLTGCQAYGDTVDEVMDNVNSATYTWIEAELEDEDALLPKVTDVEELKLAQDEFVRNVCVTMRFFDGWDE